MAPSGAKQKQEKGTVDVVNDLWQLVRDYAKQETVDPLRSIGRFLGWGLGGAVLLGLGLVFAALAILRGLQNETGSALTGQLTWVPYLVALAVCGLVIGLSIRAIGKPNRTSGARS